MFDKSVAAYTLGMERDRHTLKGVALSFSGKAVKLEKAFEIPLEPAAEEQNVKPLYTEEQRQQLQTQIKKALVVAAMPTQDVLIRPLLVKARKEKQVDALLPFQAEPLLPYPVENALLDKIILSKDQEGSELLLFAVRKDHLSEEIQQWQALEIEPEVMTAAPAALALFSKTFAPAPEPYFSLYLGSAQAFCILIDQGRLVAAQSLPFKMDSLPAALAADEKLTPDEARAKLSDPQFALPPPETAPAFHQALGALRLSIARIVQALAKQLESQLKGREAPSQPLLITGDLPPSIKAQVSSALNRPLMPLSAVPGCEMSDTELAKNALCIGCALSAQPGTREQINFRQQEFQFPDRWKRLKQPVLTYLLLCLGIATALFFYSKAESRYEEGQVRARYLQLLQVMNKPYANFEREFQSKFHPDKESGEPPNAAALSMDEIKKRLAFLEKELQSTPQIFPLQPNVPLVSDLLAWIANHPSFKGKEGEPGLQIESLTYSIVKRPEPTKKQEKYQVKVELEFSSPTPKMAREFHDALIAPNELVDPKGEIKWNSSRDRYRTSFYLKDKTLYV